MGSPIIKVVLAELITDVPNKLLIDQRMQELNELVATYGGLTVLEIVQQRARPDYRYYIGSGKLEEIKELMKEIGATLLIIGNIMKPSQIYEVNEFLRPSGLQARDRVDLILKIFDRHATSMEARLQIELAAIRHMGPRIFGMGMEMSRQGGGKGNVRGLGETNTERMRRHLSERKEQILKKLKQYEQVRSVHRYSRRRKNLPTIGLLGYTNAGKSSLMNVLTKKGVLVEDKLFATLGTSVGTCRIDTGEGSGREILINDTIGFIRDLPPDLIDAFRSTLEDSIEADLLLHVVDASDPLRADKIRVVDEILDKIGADQPRVIVLNKIDLITKKQLNAMKKILGKETIALSTTEHTGISDLKQKFLEMIG